MFTGLVRAVGWLERVAGGVRVRVLRAGSPGGEEGGAGGLGPLALGDSIAVDGVCLTVAELLPNGFRADVSGETLSRSTLAERMEAGQRVNLEPALRLADRLGGHLVSGHVDGRGTVRSISRQAHSWRLEVAWDDPSGGRWICEKASVAVDGISLTVAGCTTNGSTFWIAVIPHTWSATTLADRRPGDGVNLEGDLLAKYAERLLQAGSRTASADGRQPAPPALSATWLADHGWGG